MSKEATTVYLGEDHREAVDAEAINLSKWVRKKLEKEYPEYFD